MVSSVYEVSYHYELAMKHSTSLWEKVFDIVELAVDISCWVDGDVYCNYVGLLGEDSFHHILQRERTADSVMGLQLIAD